ncbi:MAG: periplasmic heavy metal sensor [Polyangiaceae bacterium]
MTETKLSRSPSSQGVLGTQRNRLSQRARRHWLFALVALVSVLFTSSFAFAKPKREEVEKRMQEVVRKVLTDKVGLDDKKADKVAELLKKDREEQRKLREEMRTNRKELKKLLDADSDDQKAYAKAMAALRKNRDDLHKLQNKHYQALSKELTPKQQAKLFQAMQQLQRKLRKALRKHRGE